MSDDIRNSIWVNADPDTVFDYFTISEKMDLWAGQGAMLDPQPGGIYQLDMGNAGVFRGRFLTAERPSLVVYEIDAPPGMDIAPSRVDITIEAEEGGSRINVIHSGLPPMFTEMAGRGWQHHLARLSVASYGGQPGPDPLCATPLAPST